MKHAAVQKRTLLAAAISLALTSPACLAIAGAESTLLPFPMVPLEHLANQRGGFVGAEGLSMQLNLNLRQMVFVNDQLVSDITMSLNDLATATFADMESMRAEVQAQRDTIRADANALARSIGETVNEVTTPVATNTPASSAAPAVRSTPAAGGTGARPPASSSGSPVTASGAAKTPAVPSTGVSSAAAGGAQKSSAPPATGTSNLANSASSNKTTSSAPATGTVRNTTAASVSSPSSSSRAPGASSTATAVSTPAAASTRSSELGARGTGTSASATGVNASGSTSAKSGAAPTVTQVTANNPTLTASGEALERAVVIQNGPNNHVDLDALRNLRGGTMTIIQNSLNNQSFRHVMEVDVTLSGLRNLRTMELLGGLNLQLRGAGK